MPNCEICGQPMPAGEEMFKFHGFSGPCPAPPLPPKIDLDGMVTWLKNASSMIYLAAEKSVADEISPKLMEAATCIENLRKAKAPEDQS